MRKKKYIKKNNSNWSLKFTNIIWKINNQDKKPINFNSKLTVNEKGYLLKNIDDLSIPFTNNGGNNFNLAYKTLIDKHEIALTELYKTEIQYYTIELFFRNTELVVKKGGDLIRGKRFFI